MIEAEWIAGTDPGPLVAWLNANVSERKARLYIVACCLHRSDLFPDEYSQEAIFCGERFADGAATLADLQSAMNKVLRNRFNIPSANAADASVRLTTQAAVYAAVPVKLLMADGMEGESNWVAISRAARGFILGGAYDAELSKGASSDAAAAAKEVERAAQADLLRDIFGNPFRPCDFDRSWQTAKVLELARAIYQDRAFERMPILANALREAGCNEPSILNHCQSKGVHSRGCWALDLVLGKE